MTREIVKFNVSYLPELNSFSPYRNLISPFMKRFVIFRYLVLFDRVNGLTRIKFKVDLRLAVAGLAIFAKTANFSNNEANPPL